MTSISAERSALARVGGGLIRREQWGARHNYSSARTVTEPAKQIFIHITVTQPNNYNSHAAHVRGIEAIGRSRFPSTGISYNRIVLFGVNTAYEAQPIGRRGAHTVNDHRRSVCNRWGAACPGHGGDLTAPSWNNNYTARAYAYGALIQHSVTDSVLDTFARAIADDIKAGFVRRDAKIHGHRCLSSKSCPGDHMWARMHELERRVNDHLSDTQEDDMPSPRDWNAADREAVSDIIQAALRFPQHVSNPGGQDRSVTHALSLTMRGALGNADRLAQVLASQQAIMAAQGVEVDEAALAAQIAAVLVPAVLAALPDTGLTAEQVEEATESAVRTVLGSLDQN